MSIAAQFHAAAEAARNFAALDNVSRLLWRAHAEGLLDDNATQAAAEAIEASRRLLRGPRASATQKRAYAPPRPCRSPDRTKSIARRRSVAASGSVPSKIAASFTLGEVAALSVIAREVQRQGRCALPIDAIAAMGGICRTTAQNALRQARALGLVHVQERPQPGRKHLPNLVTVASPEWRTWLKLGSDRAQKREHHEYQLFSLCNPMSATATLLLRTNNRRSMVNPDRQRSNHAPRSRPSPQP
ncbi:MAG: hypothetical protein ACLPSW_20900 [Roseiarcus sp.]